MRFIRLLVIVSCFLTVTAPLLANIYPVTMLERMDSCEQLVIAKVVNQASYWEEDSVNIYTTYTMEVVCYAKNASNQYYFDLLLPGGTVEDEVQLNYPFIQLEIGQEYLVTLEHADLYELNRKHRARSSNPKFQPYSFIQGIIPMRNGYYYDYFDTIPTSEADMLTGIYGTMFEQAKKPDGTPFVARTEFEQGNGDLDNDGVLNTYDIDPNNPDSDSDGDGITDYEETMGITGPNGNVIVSNPLNACDPEPMSGGCIGIDLDGDGRYFNYPPLHQDYDPDDTAMCIPYALAGCTLIDEDNDGLAGNLPPGDAGRDPDDRNPCIPEDYAEVAIEQDSWIEAPSVNENGGDTILLMEDLPGETKHLLMNVDFASYMSPSVYPLNQVKLKIHVDNPNNHTYHIEFYKVFQAWDEVSAEWEKADSSNLWTAGGNIDVIPAYDLPITGNGWIPIDFDVALIEQWITETSSNFGLLMKIKQGTGTGIPLAIHSRESSTAPYFYVQGGTENLQVPIIADTWIQEPIPVVTHGADEILEIGEFPQKHALMKFAIDPGLLQGKPIGGATLNVFSDTSLNSFYNVDIYKVYQDWDQNSVTWDQPDATNNWLPGGNVIEPDFTITTGGTYGLLSIDLPPFLVEEWANDPSINHGIMLRVSNSSGEVLKIKSMESNNPPFLSITFDTAQCAISYAREAPVPNTPTTLGRATLTLKNGAGETTTAFVGGTIDEENEMIIEGSGFGTNPGVVAFPNADDGGGNSILVAGSDLMYWTDTAIRLKVPKEAGSGTLFIQNTSGTMLGSTAVTIKWALNPLYHDYKSFTTKTRQRIHFIDANENGGYTIQLNTTTGFSSNTGAVAAFKRALSTWQCATDVNWVLEESGTAELAANDGICVMTFSKTLPSGVLALTSSRYKGAARSSCTGHKTLWRLKEFDIEFADPSSLPTNFSWNYSENTPTAAEFDFESIALHELGHAHGLAHIIDESSVMHFSIANGEHKHSLTANELEAAAHKLSYSFTDNCVTTYDPMTTFSDTDACGSTNTPPPTVNRTKVRVLLEGYYDESTGSLSTGLVEANTLPLAQPFTVAPFNYEGTESVTSFPANTVDWLLFELRDTGDVTQVIHRQAVLLRNDGLIMSLDGTEDILFSDITGADYYLAIHHQSHLPVISRNPHPVEDIANVYDFTTSETAAMGEGQLKQKGGHYCMNSGDFDGNGLINSSDYNLWKVNSSSVNIYSPADADGNGIINSLDYNLWKVNISKVGTLRRTGN